MRKVKNLRGLNLKKICPNGNGSKKSKNEFVSTECDPKTRQNNPAYRQLSPSVNTPITSVVELSRKTCRMLLGVAGSNPE